MVKTSITTKVYFVPWSQNIVADYLSRFMNVDALCLAPKLLINSFQPPQDALRVVKIDSTSPIVQAACQAAMDSRSPHS